MKPIELPPETVPPSTNTPVISVKQLGKCYQLYSQPNDRLKQFLWRGRRRFYREFWALHDADFEIMPGEVVGIIGRNGSGKSTLLQLVCGTLTPTIGQVSVRGRVAALLELGAGFNPEFSGRENVFMSAAIMGLSQKEIEARFDEIVDFSGIRDFIDQPVKTFSSGMYMRLAFSVAINVDPDILVIDEALSVGDGLFARKSFDRIIALKEAGKTILFCSHSMYQVEALCNRVIWLDSGRQQGDGDPARLILEYSAFLDKMEKAATDGPNPEIASETTPSAEPPDGTQARITNIEIRIDGKVTGQAKSGVSTVSIRVNFTAKDSIVPSVAVALFTQDGRCVTSAGTHNDAVVLSTNGDGTGYATIYFEPILLLKGIYRVDAWLLCDRGLFAYEWAQAVGSIEVTQADLAQGLVNLPHRWEVA